MAKKAIKPNIVRGGIGIPVPGKTNYYYMKGRKHKDGGIDIGSNLRTGLEVEDGEVIHLTDNNIKVFSSVPFLNGQSPAEKVMGGENPNKVFKQQEDFKDKNNLNDDGTKKAKYGKKAAVVRTPEDEKVSKLTRSYYKEVNPLSPYPGILDAIKHGANVLLQMNNEPDSTAYIVTDKVADATWRKRLGLSYDEKDLPTNTDGSVRLPKDRELEIPIDTNMLKHRINLNKRNSKRYAEQGNEHKKSIVDWAIKTDQTALDSLRYTYKTGEPVVLNEQAYNSRSLLKDGVLSMPGSSPLNPLKDYTLQYDKDKNVMRYRDVYDFNNFDMFVPGKEYEIKGEIDLNKKAMGGKLNKPVTVTVNGKTKVIYSPSTGDTRSEAEGNRNKGQLGLLKPINKYNSLLQQPVTTQYKPTITYNPNRNKTNYNRGSNNLMNTKDIISLSGNLLGSVLTAGLNARSIDKLNNPIAPIPKQATKLKTKINISPLINAITNSEKNNIRDIDANTASSRVALARKNKIRSASIDRISNIFREKLIGENELINKDIINQQNIRNDNISAYNKYLSDDVKFDNNKQTLKSENVTSLINNVNSSIQNVISNLDKRNKDKNTTIAIMAANPNVNPKYLRDLGFDGITSKMISDWEKANKK